MPAKRRQRTSKGDSSSSSSTAATNTSSNANYVFSRLAFLVPILLHFDHADILLLWQLRSLNGAFYETIMDGHLSDAVWTPLVRSCRKAPDPEQLLESAIKVAGYPKRTTLLEGIYLPVVTFYQQLIFARDCDTGAVLQCLIDHGCFEPFETEFDWNLMRASDDAEIPEGSDSSCVTPALAALLFENFGAVRTLAVHSPAKMARVRILVELEDDSKLTHKVGPLQSALRCGESELFELLMETGVPDSEAQRRVVFDAYPFEPCPSTALQWAVREKDLALVRRLLSGPSAGVVQSLSPHSYNDEAGSLRLEYTTPLSDAVSAVIELKKIDEADRQRRSPMKRADALELVRVLLAAGAERTSSMEIDRDLIGWRPTWSDDDDDDDDMKTVYVYPAPLHAAIQFRDEELYRLLLAHGFDPSDLGRIVHEESTCEHKRHEGKPNMIDSTVFFVGGRRPGTCPMVMRVMPPLAVPGYFCERSHSGHELPHDHNDGEKLSWIRLLLDDGARWYEDELKPDIPSPLLTVLNADREENWSKELGAELPDFVQRLVDAGCDLDRIYDVSDAEDKRVEKDLELGYSDGEPVQFPQQTTALSLAIRRGRIDVIRMLMEMGCKLEYPPVPPLEKALSDGSERSGRKSLFFRSRSDEHAQNERYLAWRKIANWRNGSEWREGHSLFFRSRSDEHTQSGRDVSNDKPLCRSKPPAVAAKSEEVLADDGDSDFYDDDRFFKDPKQTPEAWRDRTRGDPAQHLREYRYGEDKGELEQDSLDDWMLGVMGPRLPSMVKADLSSKLLSLNDAIFLVKVFMFAAEGSRLEIWSYLRAQLLQIRSGEAAKMLLGS